MLVQVTVVSPIEKQIFLFNFVFKKEHYYWLVFREQHLMKYFLERKPL